MNVRNVYNSIFFLSYGFLFITSFLSFSNEESIFYEIYQISKNVILPISWIILLFQPNLLKRKGIITKAICLSIFIYCSYISKDSSFLIAYIFILISKFIDFRLLFKVLYILSLLSIFIVVLYFLYKYYIAGGAEYLYDETNGRPRYTFEMFHPNTFPMRFFIFLTLFFIIRKKVASISFIFLIAFSFFIYSFSYSRTSLLLSLLLIMVMFIEQYLHVIRYSIVQFLMRMSMVLFPLLSLFSMVKFNDIAVLSEVNRLLSERIRLSYEAYELFGFAFLPRDMRVLIQENNIVIDNLYVSLSLSNFSFLILFSLMSYYFISFLLREKLYKESIIFFFMILYSITESHMINIGYNYILLLISLIFYSKNINKYKSWE